MLKNNKYIIFCLAVIVFVYWVWFLPGVRVANDFPFVSLPSLQLQFGLPQVWQSQSSNGLGSISIIGLWSYPITFFSGFLALLNFDFEIQEKLFFLTPIIFIGIFSINKLLSLYNVSNNAKAPSIIFYLINTYIILLVDGGQIAVALAYSLFPFAYYMWISSVHKTIKTKILSGLCIALLGIMDIRFVYIFIILSFVHYLYFDLILNKGNRIKSFIDWTVSGVITASILIGLNFYWLIPAFITQGKILPQGYGTSSVLYSLNFSSWKHAILMISPHWPLNVFGKILPINKEFFLLPIFALVLPFLVDFAKRKKVIVFWFVIALLGIFLSKGLGTPGGEIYSFLYSRFPGFSLFRDSTKFLFIVALSYSVLIAISVDALINKLPRFFSRKFFVGLLIFYLLLLARPVIGRNMTGTLSYPIYTESYSKINEYFEKQSDFSRILWIPQRPPLATSYKNQLIEQGLTLLDFRPFAIGTIGSYESLNFIREMPMMGQLFGVSAIGYIAYPYPDLRRGNLSKDQNEYYFTFLNQLKNLVWTDEPINDYPVPVIKTISNQDRFFIADNTYFVVGSDRMYWDLAGKKNFSLADNALIFAEESPGILKDTIKFPNVKVINYHKNTLDVQMTSVDTNKFVFPAKQLNFDPDSTGWWKREASDLIWWKDFLEQKYNIYNIDFDYGGGWAVSEGENELLVNSNSLEAGETLFVRAMESSKGGWINLYQGEDLIGSIDTKIENPEKTEVKLTGYKEIPDQIFNYDTANVHWFEVGSLKSSNQLRIETSGDINVVNALVAIDKSELKEINYQKFEDINFSGITDAKVSYTRIAPTHFKVRVENLTSPATLVFSESFDSFWKLDGKKSTKVYSLLNGFHVDKDGEYDLYFEPQKYVLPGLAISVSTLIAVVLLLIYMYKKK